MADDPIDRMLQAEDRGTSRTRGTLDEARQATAEIARPADRESGGLVGMMRSLRAPSRRARDYSRD
jgi:hypothetical protein